MIVSYKYGFIFVRTKKTASTAVAMGLSTICGPDDVISPLGGLEMLRYEMGALARNFHPNKELERRLAEAVKTGNKKLIQKVTGESRATGGCTGHMKAGDVKALVGEEFWNRAYKFTTERHPYEKAVSLAYFRLGPVARGMTFEEHLEKTVKKDYRVWSSSRIYSIDGKSAMDGFLFHDTLAEDIARLRERLGLPEFELPQARARKRKDRRPAVEILTEDQKEFIFEKCRFEFDLFGWQKDGTRRAPAPAAEQDGSPSVPVRFDAAPASHPFQWANDRRPTRKAARPAKKLAKAARDERRKATGKRSAEFSLVDL